MAVNNSVGSGSWDIHACFAAAFALFRRNDQRCRPFDSAVLTGFRRSETPIRVPGTRRIGGWRLSGRSERADARRRRGALGRATRSIAGVSQTDFQTLQRDADRSPVASAGAVPGRKAFDCPRAIGTPWIDRVARGAAGFPGRYRAHALVGGADRRDHGASGSSAAAQTPACRCKKQGQADTRGVLSRARFEPDQAAAKLRRMPGSRQSRCSRFPKIEVEISFAAEFDLSPMLQVVARVPEREGRWWELRQRFTHLGFAQGFDELLCLPAPYRCRTVVASDRDRAEGIEAIPRSRSARRRGRPRQDHRGGDGAEGICVARHGGAGAGAVASLARRTVAGGAGDQIRHGFRDHARPAAARRS